MSDTLLDSYSESNQDGVQQLSLVSNYYVAAQSFKLTIDAKITSFKLYLKKTNAPTGTIFPSIEVHSGVYGSTGIPYSAMSTGTGVDVATLTTSYQLIEFLFPSPATCLRDVPYVMYLEGIVLGSASFLDVGLDASSPTHGGNMSYYYNPDGVFTPDATRDLCFYLYGIPLASIAGVQSITGISSIQFS